MQKSILHRRKSLESHEVQLHLLNERATLRKIQLQNTKTNTVQHTFNDGDADGDEEYRRTKSQDCHELYILKEH